MTVTRLPILNGRSGIEPARMFLADFNERHSWISEGMSKELTTKYAITFIMGKENRLAPVLLPRDCEKATMLPADVCMYFIWQNLTAPAENMLAYAMTIHKAQGMTLDSVVVDCSSVCTPAHGTCCVPAVQPK